MAMLAPCIMRHRLATVGRPATALSFHSCDGASCWWSASLANGCDQPQPLAVLQWTRAQHAGLHARVLTGTSCPPAVAVRTNQLASHLKGRSLPRRCAPPAW